MLSNSKIFSDKGFVNIHNREQGRTDLVCFCLKDN